jgi:class 3 adenylate cyclase
MPNKIIQNVINFSESLEALSDPFDVYILFIDLCDSTSIKQFCIENSIPDSVWIMRQKIFLSRTATIVEKYGGSITKTIGDEIMATFSFSIDPDRIIKAVLEVFSTFQNLKSYNKGQFKIASKAGIDFGSCYDGQLVFPGIIDPIGTAVDRCARLMGNVGQDEIIMSEEFVHVFESIDTNNKKYVMQHGSEELKGIGIVNYHKIVFVRTTD